jgi:hypothetical protein
MRPDIRDIMRRYNRAPSSRLLEAAGKLATGLGVIVLVGVIAALCAGLLGCATVRDTTVVAANAAATLGDQTVDILDDLRRRDDDACLALPTPAEVLPCVDASRARYAGAYRAYRALRASWLAVEAAIQAGAGDATLVQLGVALAGAQVALADAARGLR